MQVIISWVNRAILYGTVILFGSLGETLTQKSGNMNLGTPGVMCIGGVFGFSAAYYYELYATNPNAIICALIGLCAGFLTSALVGGLFCLLTTTLRANQNVTGLAITIFGTGLAQFFGTYMIPSGITTVKASFANDVFSYKLIPLYKLGPIGQMLFGYGFMVWMALIVAVVLHCFLFKTKNGLKLRAVGESPATADAAGINVSLYKYLATMIGTGISGLGGVHFILEYDYGSWSTAAAGSIEALGWLAVALVIFAAWKPLALTWGSYLFGFLYWLYNYISVFGIRVTSAQNSLIGTVPYVVTIIVLIISSVRKSKENQPPASLGLTYFREER